MESLIGKLVEIKVPPLIGAQGVVLRQSKRTGGLTVDIVSPAGSAYRLGDEVHLMPFEVKVIQ